MMKTIKFKNALLAALFVGTVAIACATDTYAGANNNKTLQDSEKMIAGCLEYAAKQKYPPMSIGVIDSSSTLIAFKRQDGASSATADAALLKARTALRLNAPTDALAEAVADASTRDAFLIMQMTTLPGGVPLLGANGNAVGAVGVSGGLAAQDAECARRAADVPKTP